MKAMILAAGLGTRLGELTREVPKPMLDIAGRPLLEYNIRNLVRCGFNEIMINLHFLPEMLRGFAGDGSAFGARVEYSYEPMLLGTAGGVRQAEEFFATEEPFLVIYGDLLTDQDLTLLRPLHERNNALATLFLHQRAGSNSLVRLEEDGRISGFVERPDPEERRQHPFPWVNSGIQMLSWQALQNLKRGEVADLPRDVYPALAREGRLSGLPLSGERVAIDSPERYRQACELAVRWRKSGQQERE